MKYSEKAPNANADEWAAPERKKAVKSEQKNHMNNGSHTAPKKSSKTKREKGKTYVVMLDAAAGMRKNRGQRQFVKNAEPGATPCRLKINQLKKETRHGGAPMASPFMRFTIILISSLPLLSRLGSSSLSLRHRPLHSTKATRLSIPTAPYQHQLPKSPPLSSLLKKNKECPKEHIHSLHIFHHSKLCENVWVLLLVPVSEGRAPGRGVGEGGAPFEHKMCVVEEVCRVFWVQGLGEESCRRGGK
jgi:hypothetical protein